MSINQAAGLAPALLFKVTSPALEPIGLRRGDILCRVPASIKIDDLALAEKAGRTILGIVIEQSPLVLAQPGFRIQLDSSWKVSPVSVIPSL